ncbi:MAG: ROK family protein [Lachnospiraceae bacterium]|nr:ROK family protein [Lachnospiraceae bacterium]
MSDKLYLGVDIGGTAAKLGLVDEEGRIISSVNEYPVKFDDYETPIIETVVKSVRHFMDENNKNFAEIAGIGVSATGGINSKLGIVEGSAGHIKNWEGTNIRSRLESEFGVKTAVLNDANAAALGEMWKGAAIGKENVVVMTIGTGVGGGIIVDSKILLGRKGFAGEIGHIPVNVDGEDCSCGNKGCIEHYGSTSALVRNVKEAVISGEIKGIEAGKVDGRLIFKEVAAGNDTVKKYVDEWISYISATLVGLVHIFNPEMIILGGGVSRQKELFVDKVRERVLHGVMPNFAIGLTVEAAKLGNDAGIIGAVRFIK